MRGEGHGWCFCFLPRPSLPTEVKVQRMEKYLGQLHTSPGSWPPKASYEKEPGTSGCLGRALD